MNTRFGPNNGVPIILRPLKFLLSENTKEQAKIKPYGKLLEQEMVVIYHENLNRALFYSPQDYANFQFQCFKIDEVGAFKFLCCAQ